MQICKGTPRLLHRPGVQTRLLACRHPSQQPVAPLRPAWRTYGSCSTLFGPQYGFPAPVRPVCTQSKLSATSLDVGSPPQGEPSPSQSIWKSFWTFTGIFAMLGSVGGALAALLGYWSSSYALALPLLLPILSLIASLQREGLISEVRCKAAPSSSTHQGAKAPAHCYSSQQMYAQGPAAIYAACLALA